MTFKEASNRFGWAVRRFFEEVFIALPSRRLRAAGLEFRARRLEQMFTEAEDHLHRYGVGHAPPEQDMPWPTVSSELRDIRAQVDRMVDELRTEAEAARHP